MKCAKCGGNITEGKPYCKHCGWRVAKSGAGNGDAAVKERAERGGRSYAVAACAAAVALVLVIVLVILGATGALSGAPNREANAGANGGTTNNEANEGVSVAVPDFAGAGMTRTEATDAAKEAGINVVFVEEYSETARKGQIFSQSPEAGAKVKQGDVVTLTVSLGAQPTPKPTYTVTFKDWDGTVLRTQSVLEGTAATAPADPTREGYTFTGWDKAFDNVTADMTVTAQYTINRYLVIFVDGLIGGSIDVQWVEHGADAEAPEAPKHEDEGFTFTGWDVEFTNVTSKLIVTAQYENNNVAKPTQTPCVYACIDMNEHTRLQTIR